jgi:hypothetical protein
MPLRRRNFYWRHYKPAVVRPGLAPALRFHDLGHTCAALLIAQGVHAKAIAERLRGGLEATFHAAAAGRLRDGRGTEVVSIGEQVGR